MKTLKNYVLLVFVLALTAFGCWLGKDQLMSHDLSGNNVVLCQAKGKVVAVMHCSGISATFYSNKKAKIKTSDGTFNGKWQYIKSASGKKGIYFWSNYIDGAAILYKNYMISLGGGTDFDSKTGMLYDPEEGGYFPLETAISRGWASRASVKWY